MSPAPLVVERVSKRFGDHQVLTEVDLQIDPGEVVALRGPNGSGKSTLLGCCSGAVVADKGRVSIGGKDLRSEPVAARALMRVLPQQSELPPGLTGEELLAFWASVFEASHDDMAQARALVDLGDALTRLSTTYSVGMRRRLHFGILPMGRASLFMLDEPFAGVDSPSRERLSAWLAARCAAGVGMLVAAHDADQAELAALSAREFWLGRTRGAPHHDDNLDNNPDTSEA